jgi:hypothetical protein
VYPTGIDRALAMSRHPPREGEISPREGYGDRCRFAGSERLRPRRFSRFLEGPALPCRCAANHAHPTPSEREAHIRERADAWIGLVDAAQLQSWNAALRSVTHTRLA